MFDEINALIRPVWVEIDLEAIKANIRKIKGLIGSEAQVLAVIKAEAYGHGAVKVAQVAMEEGISWFAVATPEEGIALRQAGINANILVLGPLLPNQVAAFCKYQLIGTITLLESARALSLEACRQNVEMRIHIKIDTGMGRIGFCPGEAVEQIKKVSTLPNLKIDGIYSHFATADHSDLTYARKQLKVFNTLLLGLKEQCVKIPHIHLANSAGIINLPDSYFHLVRAGIILYGLYPSDEVNKSRLPLKPAFALKTKIVQVKRVPAGTGISYGQLYHTPKETMIATLPIGYADGLNRLLSGKARVLIGGKFYPIVGMICMDQCMVDVGDAPVQVGDEVVLIGKQGDKEITVDEIASLLGTINYEVVCMISHRVPRVYL